MFTVNLKHKEFGEIILKNITEIHYCYPSPMGKRIAFESDVDGTGGTYPVEDVIEFEARLTPDAADRAYRLPDSIQEALNSGDGTYRP